MGVAVSLSRVARVHSGGRAGGLGGPLNAFRLPPLRSAGLTGGASPAANTSTAIAVEDETLLAVPSRMMCMRACSWCVCDRKTLARSSDEWRLDWAAARRAEASRSRSD